MEGRMDKKSGKREVDEEWKLSGCGGGGMAALKVKRLCMSPCVILGKEGVAKQDGASRRTDGRTTALSRRDCSWSAADASMEYAKRRE